MHDSRRRNALNAYRSAGVEGGVAAADPRQLILMLFDGALEHVAGARGQMQRNEHAARGESIGRVIRIIGGLRSSLDFEQGGDIAARLDALYDYMERRLTLANLESRVDLLDEVSNLLNELREGWRAMPAEAR